MLKANEALVLDRVSIPAMLPLSARGLTHAVGQRHLVDDVSLTLEGTARTVVMGPNGAGKSLLLRMLHGLVAPTSGEVLWAGRTADREIRARQAMVFQRPTLLRRSAEANIRFVLGHLGQRDPRARGSHPRSSGARPRRPRRRASCRGASSSASRSRGRWHRAGDPVPRRAVRQSRHRLHARRRDHDRGGACGRHEDRARHARYRPGASPRRRDRVLHHGDLRDDARQPVLRAPDLGSGARLSRRPDPGVRTT